MRQMAHKLQMLLENQSADAKLINECQNQTEEWLEIVHKVGVHHCDADIQKALFHLIVEAFHKNSPEKYKAISSLDN